MLLCEGLYVVLSLTLIWLKQTSAAIKLRKNNKDVYCGACIGLIDEIEWEIMKVNPKKTIEVGSFRVDPNGNQRLKQIPLARSELHLTEVMETVCGDTMSKYATSFDKNSRRKTFIRTDSRDGAAVSLQNIEITGDTHKQLSFACDTLIEEYEEDLIEFFQKNEDDITNRFCVDMTGMCNSRNVTDFKRHRDEAAAATIQAEADRRAAEATPSESGDEEEEEAAETGDEDAGQDKADDGLPVDGSSEVKEEL